MGKGRAKQLLICFLFLLVFFLLLIDSVGIRSNNQIGSADGNEVLLIKNNTINKEHLSKLSQYLGIDNDAELFIQYFNGIVGNNYSIKEEDLITVLDEDFNLNCNKDSNSEKCINIFEKFYNDSDLEFISNSKNKNYNYLSPLNNKQLDFLNGVYYNKIKKGEVLNGEIIYNCLSNNNEQESLVDCDKIGQINNNQDGIINYFNVIQTIKRKNFFDNDVTNCSDDDDGENAKYCNNILNEELKNKGYYKGNYNLYVDTKDGEENLLRKSIKEIKDLIFYLKSSNEYNIYEQKEDGDKEKIGFDEGLKYYFIHRLSTAFQSYNKLNECSTTRQSDGCADIQDFFNILLGDYIYDTDKFNSDSINFNNYINTKKEVQEIAKSLLLNEIANQYSFEKNINNDSIKDQFNDNYSKYNEGELRNGLYFNKTLNNGFNKLENSMPMQIGIKNYDTMQTDINRIEDEINEILKKDNVTESDEMELKKLRQDLRIKKIQNEDINFEFVTNVDNVETHLNETYSIKLQNLIKQYINKINSKLDKGVSVLKDENTFNDNNVYLGYQLNKGKEIVKGETTDNFNLINSFGNNIKKTFFPIGAFKGIIISDGITKLYNIYNNPELFQVLESQRGVSNTYQYNDRFNLLSIIKTQYFSAIKNDPNNLLVGMLDIFYMGFFTLSFVMAAALMFGIFLVIGILITKTLLNALGFHYSEVISEIKDIEKDGKRIAKKTKNKFKKMNK